MLLGLLIVVMKRGGTAFENTGMVLAATLGGTVLYDAAVITGMVAGHITIPWTIVTTRLVVEVILNCVLALIMRRPLGWLLGQSTITLSSRRRARSI
jgi:hypothetical protein